MTADLKHRTTEVAHDAIYHLLGRPTTEGVDSAKEAERILSDVISERDQLLKEVDRLTRKVHLIAKFAGGILCTCGPKQCDKCRIMNIIAGSPDPVREVRQVEGPGSANE